MPLNPIPVAASGSLRFAVLRAVAGACLILSVGGCAGSHRTRSMGGLDARAIATRARPGPRAVATGIYRSVLSRSLYSRCRMFPSDSEQFDVRARACGALDAAVLSVARLFLEVEASPEVLPITIADRRLRWLDAPPPRDTCAP